MNMLTSGHIRMLQHIDDSARIGEVVLGDFRDIRTGLSDLAHRVGESATFNGNVRIRIRVYLLPLSRSVPANDWWGSSGSSHAKISFCWSRSSTHTIHSVQLVQSMETNAPSSRLLLSHGQDAFSATVPS